MNINEILKSISDHNTALVSIKRKSEELTELLDVIRSSERQSYAVSITDTHFYMDASIIIDVLQANLDSLSESSGINLCQLISDLEQHK